MEKTPLGKGGMHSKVEAARLVTGQGEAMVVADGRMNDVLPRILAGEAVGSLFIPASRKRSDRSRWIGSARPVGHITIDDGCLAALQRNKSLLPAGIVKIDGPFKRGDVVGIQSAAGHLIARGLSNYASTDIEKIRGKKTAQVREMLAEAAYDEVVHRDNLVMG
jgi:glutamate 5-kinase